MKRQLAALTTGLFIIGCGAKPAPAPPPPPPPPSPPPPKGCTASTAENYRPWAVVDDGSCVQGGCMDSRFDVFDPSATFNDGGCPPVRDGYPKFNSS